MKTIKRQNEMNRVIDCTGGPGGREVVSVDDMGPPRQIFEK
jgi:hypothetical protein